MPKAIMLEKDQASLQISMLLSLQNKVRELETKVADLNATIETMRDKEEKDDE